MTSFSYAFPIHWTKTFPFQIYSSHFSRGRRVCPDRLFGSQCGTPAVVTGDDGTTRLASLPRREPILVVPVSSCARVAFRTVVHSLLLPGGHFWHCYVGMATPAQSSSPPGRGWASFRS